MPYTSANAVEIHKKLRDDFRRRIKDSGFAAETVDPLLAVLFRTFGEQIETLYAETGRMRLALLDELIAGLGIERRMARPAQTVIRFVPATPQLIEAGSELIGEADTGERLTFRTDASVMVSGARIALAATYQDGALQLLSGVDLPDSFQNARPSLDPVRVNLGRNPCIFFAIENLPPGHLESHSLYFELGPEALKIQQALKEEPWCLAGSQGELASAGVLRPEGGNAGVRSLRWLVADAGEPIASPDTPLDAGKPPANLPAGFYGPRTFVIPSIPENRRFLCQVPKGMEQALGRIFGREAAVLLSEPRAWIRIGLPVNVPALQTNIACVTLHAVTASNVQSLNQTIYFDRHGTSIPISRETGAANYLVAPLSITGESGRDYLPELEPSSDPCVGRYSIVNGRVDLRPARRADASAEAYANLRVWATNGTVANRVGPGRIQSFLNKGSYSGIRVVNPTGAAGATDGEGYEEARTRFAEALLSRDRILTRDDMRTAVKAFDGRIAAARVTSEIRRSRFGLQRIEQVSIRLNRSDYVDPEVEGQILADDLCAFLKTRSLYDTELGVQVEWN